MQPVIRHSFVSFPRNAKPNVSASFKECGDSGTTFMGSWVEGYIYPNQAPTTSTRQYSASVDYIS